MLKEHFGGTVKEGVLTLDVPLRWRAVLARHEGRRVTLTVQREQLQRTLAQNRWYWSIVVPVFGDWTGYEKDEAHAVLKSLFLKVEKTLPTGEVLEVPGSTAKLTKEEFSEYCERVARFLAENGVYVPQPGEKVEATL